MFNKSKSFQQHSLTKKPEELLLALSFDETRLRLKPLNAILTKRGRVYFWDFRFKHPDLRWIVIKGTVQEVEGKYTLIRYDGVDTGSIIINLSLVYLILLLVIFSIFRGDVGLLTIVAGIAGFLIMVAFLRRRIHNYAARYLKTYFRDDLIIQPQLRSSL